MRKIVQEWIENAENDLKSAQILFNESLYDQACFHAQQSSEKYLKAYLIANSVDIDKTHDLVKLLNLCSKFNKDFSSLKNEAAILTVYAVNVRYLGDSADEQDASEALRTTNLIVSFTKTLL